MLEPADRQSESAANTWWLSAGAGDRQSLSVSEAVAAFERTAAAIRARVRERGSAGPATFYAWHDEQAGQLRCSTLSTTPDALPFGANHVMCDDLGPVVAGFLAESEPGPVDRAGPGDARSCSQGTARRGAGPFAVWVSSVGASH